MRTTRIVDVLLAIQKFDVETVSSLAKDGAPLNWTNPDDGYNPFLFALQNYGERICAIPSTGKTNEEQIAELEDSAKKATSIISIFLDNGVDVNCEDINGCTPLGCVKQYLFLGMLSFLPSAMDGNIGEKKDVMQKISKIFDDIASVLIKAGADANRVNKFGETPSEYADRIMTVGIEKRL